MVLHGNAYEQKAIKSMYKYLKTRQTNQTLWVEIHNPPVNFMLTAWLEEFFDIIKKVRDDSSVRVLVFTGGIKDTYIMHFSIEELGRVLAENKKLHLDKLIKRRSLRAFLRYFNTFNNWLMDRSTWFESFALARAKAFSEKSLSLFLSLQLHRTCRAIERLNKITIAAINGPCNGGGTEMSACFDFRFMVGDQGFSLGQPEVLIGIIPGGGGTQRVTRLMGKAKALEWMLCGNQLLPQKAKDLGFLTDVFDKKDFYKKIQEFSDIMSLRPPIAVDAIKQAVHQGMETTLGHGLSIEMIGSLRCFASKDAKMAMEKYIEFIKKNVEVDKDKRMEPEEIFHIMENAKIFDKFKGK